MSVLVTGAFGFVGNHLLPALQARLPSDCPIIAVGKELEASRVDNVSRARLDITDFDAVDELFAVCKPRRIIHLAAQSSVHQAHGSAASTYRANVQGTAAIAQAMRRHTPRAVMIFASTGELYGRSFLSGHPVREDAPVLPSNPYSRSKLAAELLLQDTLSDVCPVIALRLLNHTGAGQNEQFVASSFAAQIARIEAGLVEPVVRVGNLSAERDFLDVRDVVLAYLRALDLADHAEGYRVFNIASGQARSIASILTILRGLSTVPFRVEDDPARMRPSDIPRAVCDASTFHQATGWAAQIPFETTLAELLNWWRSVYQTPSSQTAGV